MRGVHFELRSINDRQTGCVRREQHALQVEGFLVDTLADGLV
jgi:hypothetical protein